MVLPKVCPAVWAYSRDFLDEKSKSPLFPGGGGRVTNDWCITKSVLVKYEPLTSAHW